MTIQFDPYSLFSIYEPVEWQPSCDSGDCQDSDTVYSLRCDHGVRSSYHLHNQNDEINDGKRDMDKIILEYRINDISYPLFTVQDMFAADYAFEGASEGNIVGDIAERIARRITKYWLKHYSDHGKTGGIFDERFNPKKRDDFIIANTQQYILKIKKYPNVVILKKTGKGKYGYENIKELDGLFDYRYFLKRTILVLESKIEKLSIDCDDLVDNLFTPLSFLFPEALFAYVLFTDKNSIYQKKNLGKTRQIKQFPHKIYDWLKSKGIATLFFSFNESREDIERMKDHLVTQYRAINKMGFTLKGRTVITNKEISIFDGGQTPHLKLVKDKSSGLWREVMLTHKNSKKAR
jgi:hypothetical protein